MEPGERILAVVNPQAGGGRCGAKYEAAIDALRARGMNVDVATTNGPGHGSALVLAALESGTRRFISVGGDGTAHDVVNGLFPAASRGSGPAPVLGFLPLGTGNSFLRDFATQRVSEAAADAIFQDAQRPCDVIALEHDDGVLHFTNLLSMGFVADVNSLRARRFRAWGEAGYAAAVVTAVSGLRPHTFAMKVDDGPWWRAPAVFVSFNNSKFTGGKMMMAPGACTDDGALDVVHVGPMSRTRLLRTFPKIFSGTHVDDPAVTIKRARTIEFDMDRSIDIMVDGEAKRVRPLRLTVLRHALTVQVPTA